MSEPIRRAEEASSAKAIDGADTTEMPSCVEARAAVPRDEESEACTSAAEAVAGTKIVALMSTEAEATVMATAEASTPARTASESC